MKDGFVARGGLTAVKWWANVPDMRIPEWPVEIDGVTYKAEVAHVERFHIGAEDHGIFSATIHFRGDGWGQALGPLGLGGEFTNLFLKAATNLLGSPDEAKGKQVIVLRTEHFGLIKGFCPWPNDRAEPLIVDALVATAKEALCG